MTLDMQIWVICVPEKKFEVTLYIECVSDLIIQEIILYALNEAKDLHMIKDFDYTGIREIAQKE